MPDAASCVVWLLRSHAGTYHALFALKEHCRQFAVLVVLLLLVRDVVLSVRPDVAMYERESL